MLYQTPIILACIAAYYKVVQIYILGFRGSVCYKKSSFLCIVSSQNVEGMDSSQKVLSLFPAFSIDN